MDDRNVEIRLQALEMKLRKAEDIQDIERLRATYTQYSNVQGQPDDVRMALARKWAENFVEDGVFDSDFGVFKGHQQLYECIMIGKNFTLFMHYTTNGHIYIDGDEATGRWSGLFPFIPKGSDKLGIACAFYDDVYVRTSDGWRFKTVKGTTLVRADVFAGGIED